MAFTKVNHTEYANSSTTSIVLSIPASTANDDIMFALLKRGVGYDNPPNSVPGGWTTLAQNYEAGAGTNYDLYYRVAASESADYTWGYDGAAGRSAGVLITYTGDYDTADPIDVVSNTAYTTSDTTLRAATMTVTAANSPLIFFGAVATSSSITATVPTVPVTFTEDVDRWDTNSRTTLYMASYLWTGSGATGTMDATISASTGTKHAFAVALNPAAASGDPEGSLIQGKLLRGGLLLGGVLTR
jgi:hypothetical protein